MTYDTAIKELKNILEDTKKNTCISESYVNSDLSSINPARNKINECISILTNTYNSIFNGLDSLFNNPDDEYTETNYQIINSYADASSSYDYYDSELDEFITKPEYYYVRGNLYDMLPKANEGNYVYKYITNIKDISNTCRYYESLYLNFNESGIDSSGNPIPKVQLFWNKYFTEFSNKVTNNMTGFNIIISRFNELVQFIRNYKDTFYNISVNLSKGESFISSLNKTSVAKKTKLSDSFDNISSSGFSIYSNILGVLYSLYKKSLSIRESSKKYSNDSYNNNLRMIYYSEVLVYYNFYNTAVEYYNWIISFRKQFNI